MSEWPFIRPDLPTSVADWLDPLTKSSQLTSDAFTVGCCAAIALLDARNSRPLSVLTVWLRLSIRAINLLKCPSSSKGAADIVQSWGKIKVEIIIGSVKREESSENIVRHDNNTEGSFVLIFASIGTSFSVNVYLSRIGISPPRQTSPATLTPSTVVRAKVSATLGNITSLTVATSKVAVVDVLSVAEHKAGIVCSVFIKSGGWTDDKRLSRSGVISVRQSFQH